MNSLKVHVVLFLVLLWHLAFMPVVTKRNISVWQRKYMRHSKNKKVLYNVEISMAPMGLVVVTVVIVVPSKRLLKFSIVRVTSKQQQSLHGRRMLSLIQP